MNEQDRGELSAIDPARGVPDVAPSDIQRLKEHAMTQPDTLSPTTSSAPRRRTPLLVAVAAAVPALGGVGGYVLTNDDSELSSVTRTLDLTMPGGDAIAKCIQFDEAFLAQMSPALKGTAVEVTDDEVTLEVDRWYAGAAEADNATEVRLTTPGEMVMLEGGVEFVEGTTYLITASDGVVNSCGYSGEATPELEASFERAFEG